MCNNSVLNLETTTKIKKNEQQIVLFVLTESVCCSNNYRALLRSFIFGIFASAWVAVATDIQINDQFKIKLVHLMLISCVCCVFVVVLCCDR